MIQVLSRLIATFVCCRQSFAITFKRFFAILSVFFLLIIASETKAQNCTVNASIDVSYCANQTIQLAGSVSSAVAGYTPPTTWTQVGGPSVIISNPTIPNPSILGASPNQVYTDRKSVV